MTQKLIIDSINITVGNKQYQITLDDGHVWDISEGEFDETNIYLEGSLSSMIQDLIFRAADYEKHNSDWYNQSAEEKEE